MVCLMMKGKPRGTLTHGNGERITVATLSRVWGQPEELVEWCLKDLEKHGVFSRKQRSKLIFCRWLEEETKSLKAAQRNGKKGGNPNIKGVNLISNNIYSNTSKKEKRGVGKKESVKKTSKKSSKKKTIKDVPRNWSKSIKLNKAWDDWVDHLIENKKPTFRACQIHAGRLQKCAVEHSVADALAMVERAIAGNWSAVFMPKPEQLLKKQKSSNPRG